MTPSKFVVGVTDISAPVLRGGLASAALTVPYLKKLQQAMSPNETAEFVRQAAERISAQLVESDSRMLCGPPAVDHVALASGEGGFIRRQINRESRDLFRHRRAGPSAAAP